MENNYLRTLCIDRSSRAAYIPSYYASSVHVGSQQTGLANTTNRNVTVEKIHQLLLLSIQAYWNLRQKSCAACSLRVRILSLGPHCTFCNRFCGITPVFQVSRCGSASSDACPIRCVNLCGLADSDEAHNLLRQVYMNAFNETYIFPFVTADVPSLLTTFATEHKNVN